MMIFVFHGKGDKQTGEIIASAFIRSSTAGLVSRQEVSASTQLSQEGIFVFVGVDEKLIPLLEKAIARRSKIIVFGNLTKGAEGLCGLSSVAPLHEDWLEAANCPPAETYKTASSNAVVEWADHELARVSPLRHRPFLRFDFADEWNNLAYGRICGDGGIWSIGQEAVNCDAIVLAEAICANRSTPYITLKESSSASLMWWNRPVGPVDSVEWAVIENFIADWRHEDRPVVPVVREIPHGYDGAITMRLDCDEDVASARPLFELYKARELPFSLAVKTEQEDKPAHISLLEEVLASGGAVLSHSGTHAPQWGGSLEACTHEAKQSCEWLEERLPGLTVRYAVSPFHQNPGYVPQGLENAGLKGFVGGIIANDPEMLLARGGLPPGADSSVVTHSQQCMLHGDCLLNEGDPLEIPKTAYRNALKTSTFFGYLDHPFSERYDYGWGSEENRLECHRQFLDFIAAETAEMSIVWLNEDETLDWIRSKASLSLIPGENGYDIESSTALPAPRGLEYSVQYCGQIQSLASLIGS